MRMFDYIKLFLQEKTSDDGDKLINCWQFMKDEMANAQLNDKSTNSSVDCQLPSTLAINYKYHI